MDQATALQDEEERTLPAAMAQTAYVSSSFEARQLTREFLTTLVPQPSQETTETFLLVVSELVTNALRYGNGVTDFQLGATRDTLTVDVGDSNSALPRERAPGSLEGGENGGFGWPIIRHLAHDITIRLRRNNGKIIHAGIPM
ncbi:ATP-binding protein [Streptomyces tubbatahanensis]|uniref:ATP-binding protein n=1 Tax=Streptomyces tubbatahanensis TaxID=2923272 RepID=A0ABY3XZJ9_9ACTN|nr:ATP-binding protein [Streptomyces tubbatahanensis]UNS99922.1 ATP-binding protein [Streptomyces tubbatahanensis]